LAEEDSHCCSRFAPLSWQLWSTLVSTLWYIYVVLLLTSSNQLFSMDMACMWRLLATRSWQPH
jgi:hypothetical protein